MGFEELFNKLDTIMHQQKEILDRMQIREILPAGRLSFSVREASKLTGINYNTLYKMCKSGDIPYSQTQDGGSMVILATELEDFILRNSCPSQKSLLDGKMKVKKST